VTVVDKLDCISYIHIYGRYLKFWLHPESTAVDYLKKSNTYSFYHELQAMHVFAKKNTTKLSKKFKFKTFFVGLLKDDNLKNIVDHDLPRKKQRPKLLLPIHSRLQKLIRTFDTSRTHSKTLFLIQDK